MKKVLVVVAMLLLAMPVIAATTISAVKEGAPVTVGSVKIQTVRVQYTSDVDVRAFALDINTDPCVSMKNIRDFNVGESNQTVKGYGIFPSRFRDFISPTAPNWADSNYNPTPAWNEPGTTNPPTGMGFTKFTAEMGTLFSGDTNKPALSGTLFRFDVNSEGTCNGALALTVAANALRGGIVGADANAIAGVVFNGTTIDFSCCTAEPNVAGMSRAAAVTALTGVDYVIGRI